ncbi:MAG: CBS domain-containing protein [Elusimicrobia bacterium]|nr:CBS domain-containing protein [Elusimicrobiota bacterium]
MNASDIMMKNVITVSPDLEIHKLAELFVEKNISGAPVILSGKVVGLVLEDDLIVRDRKVHLPTFVFLLSGLVTLGEKKLEQDLKKIAASTVKDIMRKKISQISPNTDIESIAALVVDKGINYFLVMENDSLIGVITKKDLVKAISENKIF